MYKFILLFLCCFVSMNFVLAETLYDLYSDYSTGKDKVKSSTKVIPQCNNSYTQNYTNQYKNFHTDDIVKQGSKNQGQYARVNKLTNPVRIDNPYNRLNDRYMQTPAQVYASAKKYNGNAVRFKKGADGKLYGYNKYGIKVGTYKVNNNGTTTQYDFYGNKKENYK